MQQKPVDSKKSNQALQLHLEKISRIQAFEIKGRIGLQAAGKGFSGQLVWQHQPKEDVLTILSPLGSHIAKIHKTPEKVTLTDAKGETLTADDLQSLTEKTLGWPLPLEGLSDWALGRPNTTPVQLNTWNESGHLIRLKQENWEIDYASYVDAQPYTLPNRLSLRREQIYLKLVIEHWSEIH